MLPDLLDQHNHGKKPAISFAIAINDYLNDRYPEGYMKPRPGRKPHPLNSTARVGQELAAYFGKAIMGDITARQIDEFYSQRFSAGQSKATIKRHQGILNAIFEFKDLMIPSYSKAKPKKKRGKSVRKKLEPGEIILLADCIEPRLRLFIILSFLCGARVSDILYLGVSSLPGARKLILEDTKNEDTRIVSLPAWIQDEVEDHFTKYNHLIQRHDGKHIFFTLKNLPYRAYEGNGGQITHAFNKAREAAAMEMDKIGDVVRANVMRQVTPHWARHTLANTLLDMKMDERSIMNAGAWRSPDPLRNNYLSDTRTIVDETINKMDYAAIKPQSIIGGSKKSDKSEG